MRKFCSIVLISFTALFSCSEHEQDEDINVYEIKHTTSQPRDLDTNDLRNFQNDSNLVDEWGRKQGRWVFTNQGKRLPGYAPLQKVEEGIFLNNKKYGKWLEYFSTGLIKSEITYNEKGEIINEVHYKDSTPSKSVIPSVKK